MISSRSYHLQPHHLWHSQPASQELPPGFSACLWTLCSCQLWHHPLWPLDFHSFAQSQHFTPGIIPQEEKWADWNTWLKPYTHWLRLSVSVCLSLNYTFSECPQTNKMYLGSHCNLDSICKLLHSLQHKSTCLYTKPDVLGSISAHPLHLADLLQLHTSIYTCNEISLHEFQLQ